MNTEWLEWKNPWWILLLFPLLLGLFWRSRAYVVNKAHTHLAPLFTGGFAVWVSRFNSQVAPWCRLAALVLMVFLMVDITRAYVVVTDQRARHRIFVLIDSSSSMYGFFTALKSITCKTNGQFFPRISGVCRALYQLIDTLERAGAGKEAEAKDLIAVGQFAEHSYVVSYLTDDYRRLRERIDRLEFQSYLILGSATNMHLAIWDMYLMALERNRDPSSGYTYLSDEELRKIALALAPGPRGSPLVFPETLVEKLKKIREELRDTTFLVTTDAVMQYLESRVEGGNPQSIRRQMQLGEYLETPWYFLSSDEFYPELARLARLTGYGLAGGNNHGDFLMVKREGDFAQMQDLVAQILQSRLGRTVPVKSERRESWAVPLAIAILTLLAMSVVWNKWFSRSLTTSE